MDEKIIRLAVYSNAIEAEMAKNYLADAGVTVFSAGGEVGGPFVGFDAGFASIELHVPQSQYETACKALESFEQHEPAFEDKLPEDDATSTAFQEHGPEWSVERAVSSTDFRSGSPPAEMQEESGDAGFVRLPGEDAEDGSAQDVSIQRTPDELALRAWRASFIGLIALPPILHIYSIWLLLKMSTMDQELSPAGMRRVYGALVIDALALLGVAIIILAILANA